jgi:hypothetical protein
MKGLALVLGAGLASVACYTSYGLGGQVRSSDCTDAAEAPLAGVHVTVQCPGESQRIEATTDARGSFHVLEGKWLDARCEVVLEKPGYVTRRMSPSELCDHTADGGQAVACGVATTLTREGAR